jgi:hypothetical protein
VEKKTWRVRAISANYRPWGGESDPILRDSSINNKEGCSMPGAKLVVIYRVPSVPTDLEKFERLYLQQHVPMAVAKLVGKTKIVATKC